MNPPAPLSYCPDLLHYQRRLTREVMVGNVGLGGLNPIRVQSMITSDTRDTPACVAEVLAMAGASEAALAALPDAVVTAPAAAPAHASAVAPAALSEALHMASPAYAASDLAPVPEPVHAPSASGWEVGLQAEALALLEEGRTDVWDVLTRRFETRLIQTALANTRGRRIEAAHKLGIGRNTITRKIQELNLE